MCATERFGLEQFVPEKSGTAQRNLEHSPAMMHIVVGKEVEETVKLLVEPFTENLIDEEVAQSSSSDAWPET